MANKLLAILLFFAAARHAQGQSQNYDSLLRAADQAQADTTRIFLLNEASVAMREADAKRALEIASDAKKIAERANYKRGLAAINANIGWINYRKGVYSEALQLSMEALQMSRELNDKKEIVNCLNNVGAISFEQKKFETSLVNFKEGYAISKQINFRTGMSRSLNNISFCFLRLKQLDSAKFYITQSINLHVNDEFRASFSKRLLGDIAFEEKNYGEALKYFEQCMREAKDHKNNFLRASTGFRIAKAFLKLNRADEAISTLHENITLAKRNSYKSELESSYLIMSNAYEMKGDFAKAMEFQTLHYQLKDSLAEQRRGEITAMIEAKSQTELKNAQIELLTKDSELKETELRSQRVLMYVGIGILLILAILIFNLLQSNIRNKEANKLLATQNELINDQALQVAKLSSTKDKILSIIGHDMRSPLAGLKGLVNLMSSESITQQEFVEVSKNLRKNLDYVYNDLDNLLSWANAQLKGIKPNPVRVNLANSIEEKFNLLSEVAKAKSISLVSLVPKDLEVSVDANHLQLIFRNLISNAIKFSKPDAEVKVEASLNGQYVNITVKDQGVGIAPDDLKKLFHLESHFTKMGTQNEKGVGLGLILVKEFVETNQGYISITSEVGKGTSATVGLPRYSS